MIVLSDLLLSQVRGGTLYHLPSGIHNVAVVYPVAVFIVYSNGDLSYELKGIKNLDELHNDNAPQFNRLGKLGILDALQFVISQAREDPSLLLLFP